jgi:hypothetical protein
MERRGWRGKTKPSYKDALALKRSIETRKADGIYINPKLGDEQSGDHGGARKGIFRAPEL